MDGVPESLKKIVGKWRIINWKSQHAFYPPDENALNHTKEWQTLDMTRIKEFPSNFLYCGIGKEYLDNINITDVQIEFTEKYRAKHTYNFNIYLNDKILNKVFWEISEDSKYCDISIVMGEVYNYARCKIEKLNDNELILLERIDNTESDAYFQKISLERI